VRFDAEFGTIRIMTASNELLTVIVWWAVGSLLIVFTDDATRKLKIHNPVIWISSRQKIQLK
jgi:hypothetical protein